MQRKNEVKLFFDFPHRPAVENFCLVCETVDSVPGTTHPTYLHKKIMGLRDSTVGRTFVCLTHDRLGPPLPSSRMIPEHSPKQYVYGPKTRRKR